jgi:ABC-type nitrate/sulfonate/bicarbonate transport system permease component
MPGANGGRAGAADQCRSRAGVSGPATLGVAERDAPLRPSRTANPPSPSPVAKVLFSLFAEGDIWPHLAATFSAALIGLVASLASGIVPGFVAALMPLFAQLIEPVMILLNVISRVILAPLFVIWLGIDLASKVALGLILVAVLIFFAVYRHQGGGRSTMSLKAGDRALAPAVTT